MNGRKIVFVNQACGYITIDILNVFASEFSKVAVIYGDIRVQDRQLDERVIRSKIIEKTRKSNMARLLRWIVASVQTYFLLVTKYRKYEIFYFSVPPFAYINSLFLRKRFSILMWDVYPDALKLVNIGENHFLYRSWAALNRYLFKKAYRIYTIGDSLAEQLAKYINHEKIKVIPLWSGITDTRPVSGNENPFLKEYGINGKFIVQYSGNIGSTYNFDIILKAAQLTNSDEDILYVIIGRGLNFEKVKRSIKEMNLSNCLPLDFLPDEMLRYSLMAADLGIVIIDEKFVNGSIPSKLYNLLAAGCPILSISKKGSELDRLVSNYGNGKNFDNKDIKGITEFILSAKRSPDIISEYSNNSRLASQNFTFQNAKQFLIDY
jgi:Glycosyl transferases group 1